MYEPCYVVCKLIGAGETEEDPVRPYITKYSSNFTTVGQEGKGCLVYVAKPTPELEADSGLFIFPRNLDDTFTVTEWNNLTQKLKQFALALGDYDPTRTVKETVCWVGTSYDPGFNLNSFKVR